MENGRLPLRSIFKWKEKGEKCQHCKRDGPPHPTEVRGLGTIGSFRDRSECEDRLDGRAHQQEIELGDLRPFFADFAHCQDELRPHGRHLGQMPPPDLGSIGRPCRRGVDESDDELLLKWSHAVIGDLGLRQPSQTVVPFPRRGEELGDSLQPVEVRADPRAGLRPEPNRDRFERATDESLPPQSDFRSFPKDVAGRQGVTAQELNRSAGLVIDGEVFLFEPPQALVADRLF